jgi:hypothetical protein
VSQVVATDRTQATVMEAVAVAAASTVAAAVAAGAVAVTAATWVVRGSVGAARSTRGWV